MTKIFNRKKYIQQKIIRNIIRLRIDREFRAQSTFFSTPYYQVSSQHFSRGIPGGISRTDDPRDFSDPCTTTIFFPWRFRSPTENGSMYRTVSCFGGGYRVPYHIGTYRELSELHNTAQNSVYGMTDILWGVLCSLMEIIY